MKYTTMKKDDAQRNLTTYALIVGVASMNMASAGMFAAVRRKWKTVRRERGTGGGSSLSRHLALA